ncbi:metal-dependent hydrolase [Piscinibacter sp.]|uniref:metal-dependent hydrolase n=1 Tax=Piscinibacter sp. TaxID=1903157 RepID=UPI002CF008F6|nr:metal-dependent hydrolase [Albitalea sp.]HUG24646.1 metal-dependent hydrolase [Albitalea sp.]
MDVLTHALLGACVAGVAGAAVPAGTGDAAGAAANAAAPRRGIPMRERLALGATAAALADLDFLSFAVDPQRFLADWHQGPTHSLLLAPLWALLVALPYAWWRGQPALRARAWVLCTLAWASHALLDALTAYGTMLLLPWSTARHAFPLLFVIDPLPTALLAAGVLSAWRWRRRRAALLGLVALALWLSWAVTLQRQAQSLARMQHPGPAAANVSVWPQPFSALNWKLVASDANGHWVAHVNLRGHAAWVPAMAGRWHALAAAYHAPQALRWQRREHPAALNAHAWNDARLQAFRRFAVLPAVSSAAGDTARHCRWFSDLRYDLPALPDTFRYGVCRDADGSWAAYRMPYLREEGPQRLR